MRLGHRGIRTMPSRAWGTFLHRIPGAACGSTLTTLLQLRNRYSSRTPSGHQGARASASLSDSVPKSPEAMRWPAPGSSIGWILLGDGAKVPGLLAQLVPHVTLIIVSLVETGPFGLWGFRACQSGSECFGPSVSTMCPDASAASYRYKVDKTRPTGLLFRQIGIPYRGFSQTRMTPQPVTT